MTGFSISSKSHSIILLERLKTDLKLFKDEVQFSLTSVHTDEEIKEQLAISADLVHRIVPQLEGHSFFVIAITLIAILSTGAEDTLKQLRSKK